VIDREILAQVRRIEVRTNRLVTDVMTGGYTSVFRGSGIEFDEVREFAEGDDMRSVDWNVTARTGRPHVKKFMEERELTLAFVLDLSASTGFGTIRRDVGSPARRDEPRTVREAAAQFCACLALSASRNNDKTGLIAFSDRVETYVPAKKGKRHVLRLIREALAAEPVGRSTDLAVALDFLARVQRKRAVVFVVSDFLFPVDDAGWPRVLRRVGRRHDVIAAVLTDPATRALPNAGLLRLRDPETGVAAWVDTGSRRVRDAYARAMAAHDQRLTEAFRRASVDVIRVDLAPGVDVAEPILRFFRMRERRGARG
jgi:uncharacterized protein (DUF58 family)